MHTKKDLLAGFIVSTLCLLAVLMLFFIPEIPQDKNYHAFVDQRSFFSIVNFSNVMSNALFLVAGLSGLYQLLVTQQLRIIQAIRSLYIVFFGSIVALSFGSAYYHLAPTNYTLVWDRLPMSIGFMSLLSLVISEFISIKLARRLFIPLVVAGISSVLYWHYTEQTGNGDLRFYILTQFLPMLIIPLILLLYRKPYEYYRGYVYLLVGYFAAKLFEHFDQPIYELSHQFISGHSLKHIAAATAILLLISTYKNRQPIRLS